MMIVENFFALVFTPQVSGIDFIETTDPGNGEEVRPRKYLKIK